MIHRKRGVFGKHLLQNLAHAAFVPAACGFNRKAEHRTGIGRARQHNAGVGRV